MNSKSGIFILSLLIQSLLLINTWEAFPQEDSLYVNNNLQVKESEEGFKPDPAKAAMYSAVLPGMGQVYNRKYWKVPIVYAGFAGLTWYTMFAHEEFVRYRNAIDFRVDGNPETIDEFAGDARYTDEVITRFKDYYRRQRDRTVIWTTLFYVLNIIDATVDAHLFEFDVSEDLGMKIGPSFHVPDRAMPGNIGKQTGMGIRFSVNF
ncbi:MAG: DUF5683 domain-containing protein [bacterium]